MNGAKYEGFWKDDLQEGQGTEIWADGSKYEGNYKEGKKHGFGNNIPYMPLKILAMFFFSRSVCLGRRFEV